MYYLAEIFFAFKLKYGSVLESCSKSGTGKWRIYLSLYSSQTCLLSL